MLRLVLFCGYATGMIGVFDSGLGGLYSMEYFLETLREYDFCYLADTAYVPYGDRSPQWIEDRTCMCLHWLFAQGCSLVIVACNTATAVAIRHWQNQYPHLKALSVTVPGVEKVIAMGLTHIGILATRVTVATEIYQQIFDRRSYKVHIEQVIGDGLVSGLEAGGSPSSLSQAVSECIGQFSSDMQGLVLGCTHYPILYEQIVGALDHDLPIINPAWESAHKLSDYLKRHGNIAQQLSQGGSHTYFTTGDVSFFNHLGSSLLGREIGSYHVVI